MALTENIKNRGATYALDFCDFVMAPSVTIYYGAALTIDAGKVRPLTSGAGKKFIGFAMDGKTTTAGQTRKQIPVQIRGQLSLAVAGAALRKIGDPVYATDDNTFTMSADGEAVKMGRLLCGDKGKWRVYLDSFCMN